jgi:hypothetical protein
LSSAAVPSTVTVSPRWTDQSFGQVRLRSCEPWSLGDAA